MRCITSMLCLNRTLLLEIKTVAEMEGQEYDAGLKGRSIGLPFFPSSPILGKRWSISHKGTLPGMKAVAGLLDTTCDITEILVDS